MISMCLYVPVQNRSLKLRSYQLLSCSSKPPRLETGDGLLVDI